MKIHVLIQMISFYMSSEFVKGLNMTSLEKGVSLAMTMELVHLGPCFWWYDI